LFLALLTLAAVGYMIVEERRTRAVEEASSDSFERLAGRIDQSQQSLSSLDDSVDDLVSSDEALESRIAGLQRELEQRADMLDSLPGRMSNIENSVAALQGASAGARDTWLLAEAEYYMQIANAQLQLGNNPRLAMLALEMADERVVQMANPALTDVRRALAEELAALEAMEKPDLEGATLTLASLARVVDSLPLRAASGRPGATGDTPDEEQGAAERAWSSVKEAMSGLVKVTPPDEETRALLTPDAAHLIRQAVVTHVAVVGSVERLGSPGRAHGVQLHHDEAQFRQGLVVPPRSAEGTASHAPRLGPGIQVVHHRILPARIEVDGE
jgi:uncharacterized protein HemX